MVAEAVHLHGNPLGPPQDVNLVAADAHVHFGRREAALANQGEESGLRLGARQDGTTGLYDRCSERLQAGPATIPVQQACQFRHRDEPLALPPRHRGLQLGTPDHSGGVHQCSARRRDRDVLEDRSLVCLEQPYAMEADPAAATSVGGRWW
jgi:hypothetical protein